MTIKKILRRPPVPGHGEPIFVIDKKLVSKQDERALVIQFVCNRRLFDAAYSSLIGDYYDWMPLGSGVLISGFVPTKELSPNTTFPGDVDLLLIPYEGGNLILSKVMAIEVKAVRATYLRQNKSPNQFGFSQAKGLLDCGFPYVALAHLVVSDDSPEDKWREVLITRIINADTGECEEPRPMKADLLPVDLMNRTFGRLKANCPNDLIGLLSAYVKENEFWLPSGTACKPNPKADLKLMERVGEYFHAHPFRFLDTPKYPPEVTSTTLGYSDI